MQRSARFVPPWLVKPLSFVVPVLVIVGILAAITVWRQRGGETSTGEIWTCSMHPQVRQSRPGQCPICGMNLIPLSQLAEKEGIERRAGIETEPVAYRELFKEIHTVGKLDYNESQIEEITARVAGRVDRLYADFTGINVKLGDHLVDIYSPELFVAQEELQRSLKAARRSPNDGFSQTNLESARMKLRLLGLLPEQIAEMEQSQQPRTHLTIYAPIGGTVIEKRIRVGQYVNLGDMLYRIASFDPIWLYLDVYESDLNWVRFGQQVDARVEAFPGEVFRGTVTFRDPYLNDETRTLKARVNLKNSDGKLKPAMYASATIRVRLLPDGTPEPTGLEGKYLCPMHPEVVRDEPGACPICGMQLERVPVRPAAPARPMTAGHEGHAPAADQQAHAGHGQPRAAQSGGNQVLAVPASAVLDTGRRQIAYRRKSDGSYELLELQLGPRAEAEEAGGRRVSYFPVLAGLQPGDQVVVRGGFLLDSQQQITGMPSLLFPEGRSVSSLHAGHGGDNGQPAMPAGHQH